MVQIKQYLKCFHWSQNALHIQGILSKFAASQATWAWRAAWRFLEQPTELGVNDIQTTETTGQVLKQ